ncbi:MAG: sulfite exporter TauE/SafE family protein [Alphaproteobacteria bacterium]|nr:sulfite exporter TauE/SafE family protein [Alphaproteobacteria bacterium]
MELAYAAAVVFCAQVVLGVTGFGQNLVAIPLLLAIWSPPEAMFAAVCLSTLAAWTLLLRVWPLVMVPLMVAILVPMFLGQHLGSELLLALPDGVIRRVFGGLVFLFALDALLWPVKRGRGEWTALPEAPGLTLLVGGAVGAVSGLMSGLSGMGGPPLVVFLRRGFTDAVVRAQLVTITAVAGTSLALMLLAKGAADPATAWRVVILLPPMFLGVKLGERLSGRLSRERFGRAVGALLLLAGLKLMV